MMKTLLMAALTATALTASPLAALAAGPHDGAWESVVAKSFWSDGKLPKDFKLTVNMKFSDNKLEYHSVNTTMPDKPYISDHVTTLDGVPTVFADQARFNQVAVLQTGPNDLQILKMKDGDVIAGEFWTFSPDGKMAIRRGVGKNPEGHSHAYQEVFAHK